MARVAVQPSYNGAHTAGLLMLLGLGGYVAWKYTTTGQLPLSLPIDLSNLFPQSLDTSLPGLPTDNRVKEINSDPKEAPAVSPPLPTNAPRGIRNNNPGNIVWDANNHWVGQTGSDGTFAKFDTIANGIRAMVNLLNVYLTHYRLNTINAIGSRWDNDPPAIQEAWKNNVAHYSGIARNAIVTVADIPKLARGIIGAETGGAYVNVYPASYFQG